jgi:hypothetical protein
MAHSAAHTAFATGPSHSSGRREATMVPTAAAPQSKATCRAKGALARRAARLTSRIQSRSINEPPRANIDPLPRHPATRGLTALEILKRDLASHRSNAELNFAVLRVFRSLPGIAKAPKSARSLLPISALTPRQRQSWSLTQAGPAALSSVGTPSAGPQRLIYRSAVICSRSAHAHGHRAWSASGLPRCHPLRASGCPSTPRPDSARISSIASRPLPA